MVGSSTYLDDVEVRRPVGSQAAAVHLKVLPPLDVGRHVAGHDALEGHVAAHHHRVVCGQTPL